MNDDIRLTSDLARAARALTKVSAGIIGQRAGISKLLVREFEQGVIDLPHDDKERLSEALEHYGALFVPEDEDAGYGVRRRHTREKLMRLNTWEGEGGSA